MCFYRLCSNNSNENIGNDLTGTGTQSNKDLIEALKSKLLDEFMLYIKMFIKEELKFSKQENDLVDSDTEIIKSLEKELEFLKQELVNKNKNCTRQKYSAIVKIAARVAILILILTYQL